MKENYRILLAEDEEVLAGMIKAALAIHSIEVDLAENGVVAADKALKNQYDLIILDINMPFMDGKEAISHIKQHCPGIKMAAFTAQKKTSDVASYFKAGFDDVIAKPIDLDLFLRRVKDLLSDQFQKLEMPS